MDFYYFTAFLVFRHKVHHLQNFGVSDLVDKSSLFSSTLLCGYSTVHVSLHLCLTASSVNDGGQRGEPPP